MPVYNVTIPDTSPLIIYTNGIWEDSSLDDPKWANYTDGTFHATDSIGAMASLVFNGSAVYVVGAQRANHGEYTVTLDGTTSTKNGSAVQDSFNCTLFSQTDLSEDEHHLSLQNEWTGTNPTWFDVDYMIITVGDGDPSTQSSDTALDDGHQNITYSAGWDTSPNGLESFYYMRTMHRTNRLGASASIAFWGNAISLYGATSSNHGIFSITLDGLPIPYHFNGSAPIWSTRWQNLLYYSGGLSTGLHNLTVTHADPRAPEMWFDLDKVVISTWPSWAAANANATANRVPKTTSLSASASATSESPTNKAQGDGSPTNRLNAGVIMAIAITAVVGAFLMASVILIMRRRARIQRHRARVKPDLIDKDEDYEVVQYPSDQDQATEYTPLAFESGSTSQTIPSNNRLAPAQGPVTASQNVHGTGYPPPPDYSEATGLITNARQ